ncbi:MAG: alpha/beta hydrolase [Alistipes indistinctus]
MVSSTGITYAVLKYRMPHGHVEIIREDIREAIRLIRARSAEWGIQQVGVMGASIGGYIAATAATLYHGTDRADFQILLYPVISMTDQLTHLPSRCRMLGENIPEAEKKALSLGVPLKKRSDAIKYKPHRNSALSVLLRSRTAVIPHEKA